MKLLIIEDERELLKSMKSFLSGESYSIETATDCFNAEDKILSFKYNLIILDIGLPDGNGLKLIDIIKTESPETGILIVSAKNSLDDKVKGLNLGADDYITKPFHFAELNSRIQAILRRRNFEGRNILRLNDLEINTLTNEVFVNSKTLQLTKTEYDLLLHLSVNKNQIVSKISIAEHLWGDVLQVSENLDIVYTHIKNLRKKIVKANSVAVKTVYGIGYKLQIG